MRLQELKFIFTKDFFFRSAIFEIHVTSRPLSSDNLYTLGSHDVRGDSVIFEISLEFDLQYAIRRQKYSSVVMTYNNNNTLLMSFKTVLSFYYIITYCSANIPLRQVESDKCIRLNIGKLEVGRNVFPETNKMRTRIDIQYTYPYPLKSLEKMSLPLP